jgi:periplasmic protein TonB
MAARSLSDVYTLDEVARAAHVPRAAVEELLASSEYRLFEGFVAPADALALGRRLRTAALSEPLASSPLFSAGADTTAFAARESRLPALLSSSVHAAVVGLILWATAGTGATASTTQSLEPTRLVFLMTPGAGGGGGGGGNRAANPATKLQRQGPPKPRIAVPKVTPDPVLTTAKQVVEPPKPTPAVTPQPAPKAPEPVPSQTLIAPVAENAADARDRAGVIDKPAAVADSQGSGVGGGAGSGQGTGNGQGLGSGIGEGSGGGTGGGPFRPGSGIEAPRLLREVKAEYTEDARRRNIRGDVVLEIVVRSDGTVGDVRVLQGLGGGLESRAIAAVRQWKFAPATRRGQPVDVLVEVAVEFTLR